MARISISTIAAAVAAAVVVPTSTWAQAPPDPATYGYGPHMMWWGGGWFGMVFGSLFMILVLALVIAVAVLVVRWLGGPGAASHQARPPQAPLDILRERFARGEINKDEFEERRRVLGD
jgi:putative membrane protein